MITSLAIRRFKSIKSLELACRKVNVFIGPPDTGKTNILDALTFLSRLGWGLPLDQSLRLRPELGFDPLFYRQFFDQPFEIEVRTSAHVAEEASDLVSGSLDSPERLLRVATPLTSLLLRFGQSASHFEERWRRFRAYSYVSSEQWLYDTWRSDQIVAPPHGDNLLYVARHDQRVYDFLKDLVSGAGWKLRFDQAAKTFRMSDVRQDEILDYNLDLLSDSLKRFFFYGAILLTSENATLVLDEPDVFAFPPYPKTLGEMIGHDTSNQFFVTTHNPYFLAGVLGKTASQDLALFLCSRDTAGDTAVRLLDTDQVARAIEQGANVFFNLDDFLEA